MGRVFVLFSPNSPFPVIFPLPASSLFQEFLLPRRSFRYCPYISRSPGILLRWSLYSHWLQSFLVYIFLSASRIISPWRYPTLKCHTMPRLVNDPEINKLACMTRVWFIIFLHIFMLLLFLVDMAPFSLGALGGLGKPRAKEMSR